MNNKKSLAKNTFILSSATFISRILGLLREITISYIYGLGRITDSFFLSFMIPNLLRQLFAEGAFNNAFIPVFSNYMREEDKERRKDFLDATFTLLLFTLIIISVLGILLAPYLIKIFAPGFSKNIEQFKETVFLLRILFPYIIFISLSSLLSGILNTYGNFLAPGLIPVWLNLSMILFAISFSHKIGIVALAIGVIVGGIFQFLSLILFVFKKNIRFSLNFNIKNSGVMQILSIMAPAAIAVFVNQINIVIDKAFASVLEIGSISALYYSNRLMQFPLGGRGITLSTVFFPLIAKYIASKEFDNFENSVSLGIRMGGFIMLPSAFMLFLFSPYIVSIIYQHGIFTSSDTYMTSMALKYYTIGLFFYSGSNFLNRVFYSLKDSKTPMHIGVLSVILNIILDIILMHKMSYKGLALATSISGIFNFSLLLFYLYKRKHLKDFRVFLNSYAKILFSCVIMISVSLPFLNMYKDFWLGFILPVILSFIIYFFILFILKSEEVKFILQFRK